MSVEQAVRTGRAIIEHFEQTGDPKRANDMRFILRSMMTTKQTLRISHRDALQYRAALRAAEWGGLVDLEEGYGESGYYVSSCPVCGGQRDHGHKLDCALNAALKNRPCS